MMMTIIYLFIYLFIYLSIYLSVLGCQNKVELNMQGQPVTFMEKLSFANFSTVHQRWIIIRIIRSRFVL